MQKLTNGRRPSCRDDRQQLDQQQDERRNKNHAVKAIEDTAVSGQNIAEILDMAASFNEGKTQIANDGNARSD